MRIKNSFTRTIIPVKMIFVLTIAGLFNSCSTETKKEEPVIEEHAHEEQSTTAVIDSAQFRQLDVQLSKIEERSMTSSLRTTGFLKVPPQNKAAITSSIGGTVESILVMEGDYVNKGQVLATLTNPAFIKMQEDFLEAGARLTFAEEDFERQKELSRNNATSQKSMQQSEANYISIKSKRNSLKQQLLLLNVNASTLTPDNISSVLQIKSPISGSISHIEINIGTAVDQGKELMDIVDNSHLHLDLFLFEQDLPKVKKDQMVELWLTNLPGRHYKAKIFGIGSAFEGDSKSISVHAEITGDKKGLIEGMNVTALIGIDENMATVVPTSAITNYGGSEFIFIVADEKEISTDHEATPGKFTFQRVPVKKGTSRDGFTEIIPLVELQKDAVVVSNGSYYLNAMLTNESGEHGH